MPKSPGHILVLDDQAHILEALEWLLEGQGYQVSLCRQPQQVPEKVQAGDVDLLLMDMNFRQDTTSGKEGLALIQSLRQSQTQMPIVVMTAWASIELSVEAMRLGANDFIEKPWKNQRLLSVISNQLALAAERHKGAKLAAISQSESNLRQLIANSKAMQPVLDIIQRTAQSDANILLTGESGVGKSLIAEIIHSQSLRANQPLVSVNMGALSDSLFESELFGHLKGAYTDAKSNRMGRFEMADQGTLFMDEIANIPHVLQGKLLRVLESGEFEVLGSSQTRKVDARIISASNADFNVEVAEGRFRQDLLYRLNTITIEIPPLRQRIEDIPALATHFLQTFGQKYRRPQVRLSEQASNALSRHKWPGNVRELSHCLERAVLMCRDNLIQPDDLGLGQATPSNSLEQMTLEQAEQYLIQRAMAQHQDNVADAAQTLGISRSALYRRLEKFGLLTDKTEGESGLGAH